MLKALIDFLLNRKGHPQQHDTAIAEVAPYKVETPAPAKCGCGRSPTGNCVGHHKLTDTEWAAHPDNPVKPVVEVKTGGEWPFPEAAKEMKPAVKAKSVRAKKAPVAAITPAEKPKKAPAKPRAKKAKE
jgi:hypothetical protein